MQEKPSTLLVISVFKSVPHVPITLKAIVSRGLGQNLQKDDVWINQLPDANTVISNLKKWFDDYNEHTPHKGLKRLSPRQFLRKVS